MKKTAQEIRIGETNSRENIKRFSQFNWFISQIENGKTAIIFSPDFVVVDWETWKKFINNSNNSCQYNQNCSNF